MACLAEAAPQNARMADPAIVPVPWPESPVNSTCTSPRHAEERGSILDGVARGISNLWLSEASPHEDEVMRANRSGTQENPSGAAAQLAQDLKRLSSDLTGGLSSRNLWEALSVQFCGSASAAKPSAMPILCAGIDAEDLLEECRDVFRQLLLESPEPNFTYSCGKNDEWLRSLNAFPELMRPHHDEIEDAIFDDGVGDAIPADIVPPANGPSAQNNRALQRRRLIGHVCNCFRAVQRILKGDRIKLWIQFVSRDELLQCALPAEDDVIYDLLEALTGNPETFDKMASQLPQTGEVDFADILDVVETEHGMSRASFSLGNSLGLLLSGNNEVSTSSAELQETARQLERRCRKKPLWHVTATAAAYHRSLIVTASWQAETMLRGFLSPSNPNNPSETPELCKVLLCVFRGIRAELAPVERLMWEYLAKSSRQVNGSFARMEVLEMLSEMQKHVLEKERSLGCFESDADEFELRELRAQSQQQAVNEIFAECPQGQGQHATLPDCLFWWRKVTDEYREAMGLAVPTALLQQQVQRQPEEMFRTLLRRVAADAEAATTALQGYSSVFSKLRALDVRHAIAASFTSLASAEQDTTDADASNDTDS